MNDKYRVRENMFQVEQARKSRLHPIWSYMGLIAGQPRVLSRLFIRDKVTQKELSQACSIDPATLSRALDRLEAMGLILRQNHPNSRRAVLIELTKEGREKAGEVVKTFDRIDDMMLEGISDEEAEAFLKTLEHVYRNLTVCT